MTRTMNIEQRKGIFRILKGMKPSGERGVRFSELWKAIENQDDFYCSKGQLSIILRELEYQKKIKRISWEVPQKRCGFMVNEQKPTNSEEDS